MSRKREGKEKVPNSILNLEEIEKAKSLPMEPTSRRHRNLTAEKKFDLFVEVGAHRIILSADYPYGSLSEVRQFLEQLPVGPADKERIADGNAELLMRL